MAAAIDSAIIHRRISMFRYNYTFDCTRYRPFTGKTVRFLHDTAAFRLQPRVSNLQQCYFLNSNNYRSLNWKFTRIHANSPREHDTDSTDKTETPASSETSKNSGRREKQQRKNNWWNNNNNNKSKWQPIIQAQEMGVLLIQLGIVMFVMRLLRPGIPLPGSEPRAPTTFISVPYSEFLSRINGNQVQKVEVDGVHIMFKLKRESGGVESGGGGEIYSKLQESESLLRSVGPTKRVVYTTTRPIDIKTPYEKMVDNGVEFGSPDKRSGGFLNSALIALFYVAVLAGLLNRFRCKLFSANARSA